MPGRLASSIAALLVLPLCGCTLDTESLTRPTMGSADGGEHQPPAASGDAHLSIMLDSGSADVPPDMGDAGTTVYPTGRTCGVVGMPCCERTECDTGVCLRGVCAGFGGTHETAPTCTGVSCRSRNPYTAGCSCPFGFDATPVMTVMAECDGGRQPALVTLCTAPGVSPGTDFAGAWLSTSGVSGCAGACVVPNTITGNCGCPAGTRAIETRITTPSSCGEQPASLSLCLAMDAPTTTFAGAYQWEGGDCSIHNPLTGDCSCPEGSAASALGTMPSPIHVCTR